MLKFYIQLICWFLIKTTVNFFRKMLLFGTFHLMDKPQAVATSTFKVFPYKVNVVSINTWMAVAEFPWTKHKQKFVN